MTDMIVAVLGVWLFGCLAFIAGVWWASRDRQLVALRAEINNSGIRGGDDG